jgi:GT2 family glycosyltransferase
MLMFPYEILRGDPIVNNLPKVSIVIVNFNGKQHLNACLTSILRLNYPKDLIEVIIVDNNSTDGSIELLQSKYSWVKLIRNSKNEGFAKPSNDGARAAKGELVAFLNNDMRVQRDWLIELVKSLKNNNAQCAGSVCLMWNGKLVDFVGGSISFYGMGYQFNHLEDISGLKDQLSQDKEILFACGGSMLVDRNVFLSTDAFDEDYFAYFEDLDFGWRLKILGYKTVLSVKSRVYHKHHSTGNKFSFDSMQVVYDRNKLYTIYKNYDEELLQKAFWPSILMDIALLFDNSGIDKKDFDLRISKNETSKVQSISSASAAQLCALREFIYNIPKFTKKRNTIQSGRKCSDDEIIKFIPQPFICLGKDIADYNKVKFDIVKTFGIDKAFKNELKRKVLLVCSDKIGKKMAGPAIRYFEFAKVLANKFDVALASFGASDIQSDQFKIISYDYENPDNLTEEARTSDIIIFQGFVSEFCSEFYEIAKTRYLVIDLYDPYVIENVEIFKDHEMSRRKEDYEFSFNTLVNQLNTGDFFICANEKQKDYWFGMLSALGRLTPEAHDYSNNGNKIVSIVPFGLSDEKPQHNRSALKGVLPGINADDKVIIWGGGVWNWFDPLTLIKAMNIISQKRSDVKLFFMGVKHPNPSVPKMKMLNDAVELAKELNIYDKNVFFNFGWVDYDDRQNYLLEADIGVSCHFETLETRFSFRTRILDYLWASLPIICTKGDHFANLVEKQVLGISVDYEDENELTDAILKLLDDNDFYKKCKENMSKVSENFKWSNVTQPLVEFCDAPLHLNKNVANTEPESNENVVLKRNVKARQGSLFEKLNTIEEKQNEVQRLMSVNSQMISRNKKTVEDIQAWTYMMNSRFNRVKIFLRPFKWLFGKKK